MQDKGSLKAQISTLDSIASTEAQVIVPKLSDEGRLRMEVIQSLMEPCDRATYGEKLRLLSL